MHILLIYKTILITFEDQIKVTLSLIIILMLFIQRTLRFETQQMLQNGLIILTFVRSYKRDNFDFSTGKFPYLSSNNIPYRSNLWLKISIF